MQPWRVRRLAHLLCIWLGMQPFAALGTERDEHSYRDQLLARAQELELAKSRGWRALLHAPYNSGRATTSGLAAGPFFLAPDGEHDVAAELDATIRSWFDPAPLAEQASESTSVATPIAADLPGVPTSHLDAAGHYLPQHMHPLCRFPARALWLAAQLDVDFRLLPQVQCVGAQRFFAKTQAKSVTLVFSGYHMAAPASAFGHTFLRLNRASPGAQGKALELLDQAVDYSADVDTANPFAYAIKGMIGAFPGVFHAMPYFYKVREYNDFESRDLWEYELDLTPDQVLLIVAHLWELGWTHAPYYYVSGNCAFHVLALLDAVNPRLEVSSKIGWPALPVNGVKRVNDVPGLVREVRFRPSLRRQFRMRTDAMGANQRRLVRELLDDPNVPLDGLTEPERAATLDAAADLVDVRFARELVFEPEAAAHGLRRQILERRAQILIPSAQLDDAAPQAERPDKSHDTRRVGVAGTYGRGLGALVDVRLTMHDLMDPPIGYPVLGQLEFLAFRAGWESDPHRFVLDRADLVHAISLQPIDRFDAKPSWRFRVGVDQRRDALCPDCIMGTMQASGGAAVASRGRALAAFLMTDVQVQVGPHASALWPYIPLGLSAGGVAGVRWQPNTSLVLMATSGYKYVLEEVRGFVWTWDIKARVAVTESVAIGLEGMGADSRWRSAVVAFLYF